MAVTHNWYGGAMQSLVNKEVDFDGGTIKVSLHTSSYTPDQDAHRYQSSLTNECPATGGYVAGGTALANGTVVYTAATNTMKLDADDVSWPASTISAQYAVMYAYMGTVAAANPLLTYVNFGTTIASSGGAFTLTWGTAGIATITVS